MKILFFMAAVVMIVSFSNSALAQYADLVFKNANVHTGSSQQPKAQSIAIIGNKIVAVGSDAEIQPWIGPKTSVFPVNGKLIVPGFNDAHVHFMETGQQLSSVDLRSAKTPQEFVERIYVDALHSDAVIVGEDTRFGWQNTGNVDTMRDLGASHGFEVVVLTDIGDGERWSSSMARAELAEGDVEGAAVVLGRPHRVCGTVVHGDHRGRELGFPTANLGAAGTEGLVPADGVYAGWLTRLDLPTDHAERVLPAAVSIGTNPTFEGDQRRVEGYVLDRTDLDLYGERICYEFVRRLRETVKFDGVESLVEQMQEDVAQCRDILRTIVPT